MKQLIWLSAFLALALFAQQALAQERNHEKNSNKKHHTEMMKNTVVHKKMRKMCRYHMMKNDMESGQKSAVSKKHMKSAACPIEKSNNTDHSLYIGQGNREIKALSAQQISGYLQGRGMGFSKVAELNHYPGPKHVLALSEKLNLTANQHEKATAAFKSMKRQAQYLGERLIGKERQLDELFKKQKSSKAEVQELLQEIGELQAEIRFTHIQAHMKAKEILTPGQVKKYDKLRGYRKTGSGQMQQNQHHHSP